MRTMEDTHFVEQDNSDTASFAFDDFGSEFSEERLDVAPLNVRADGMSANRLQSPLMLSLHTLMVP